MYNYNPMQINNFRFWCQKVLPLVYDDSLSYYEVLCKLADGFKKLLALEEQNAQDIDALQAAMDMVQKELELIRNGDYGWLQSIIQNAIKNVWFGITDAGYFVAYVPESWSDITFRTTGYDYETELMPDFGHLVLIY